MKMQESLTHAAYQIPNEHTQVGYLLASIDTNDAELQAAMANVNQEKTPNGLRKNFEFTVATILPADPISKKQVKGSKHGDEISSMDFEQDEATVASTGKRDKTPNGLRKNFEDTVAIILTADPVPKKQVKGSKYRDEISSTSFEQYEATVASTDTMNSEKGASTGVNLRFHTSEEYTNLTHLQRHELKAWRITPEGRASMKASKAQRSGNNNNSLPRKRTGEQAKLITDAVETAVAKKEMSKQIGSKDITQARAFVIFVFNKLSGKMSATPRT